ncbi:flagellar protein FlaG [Acidaminobacter hydrogenoformans]|uniref:Flagellar protein FlaG n=1 Tax=Acidaminobacter hydrogenoformans DSM 2784 TaxID=1120920 RepID=A0A1G5RWX4_9FIRM|nr:flagellar protein FlaG [Acidaminobacter hydrogenoformans]SCZ77819.1 flagellar protein FlaG [Acidaminobacter hydrogenoformans DSM 2784]
MDYKIERIHHANPSLRVIEKQGQRIPLEQLKDRIDQHFGKWPEDQKQGALGQSEAKENAKALMEKVLRDANDMMQGSATHFEFKIHEKSGEIIVKLIEDETNQVIREIPSEKLVEIISNLQELVGLCVDQKI